MSPGSDSHTGLVKTQIPRYFEFESEALEWSLRINISNNFPGDAAVSVLGPHLDCSEALTLVLVNPVQISKDFGIVKKGSKGVFIFLV